MYKFLEKNRKSLFLLMIPLVLSSYTHLWNPVGFPDIFFDEGIYMRRAINMLETSNPQEGNFYDHPFFGQIVLAGFLKITGFPQTVEESLQMSYLLPRILMGLFAILDTFLIYKITEKKFSKRTAFLASILFAVMPMTWMFRRILLDNILLPLLLSSILLALYSKDSKNQNALVLGSSVLLGLAIFTKVTVVTMIPIVAYIIVTNYRLKTFIKWLPLVFIIPLIWPAIALYLNQLDLWFRDVFWQASRSTGGFLPVSGYLFSIDPIMMTLGFVSFGYAAIKKNFFLIFWFAPFLIFVNTVGFFQYFHYILIIPIMCIGISYMITDNLDRIKSKIAFTKSYFIVTMSFAIFGLVITSMIITTDMSSAQFDALTYTISNYDDKEMTLLASPVYTWILSDVYDKDNVFVDYADILNHTPNTDYLYVIIDPHYILDQNRGTQLVDAYQNTEQIVEYVGDLRDYDTNQYPFTNLNFANEGEFIFIHVSEDVDPKYAD